MLKYILISLIFISFTNSCSTKKTETVVETPKEVIVEIEKPKHDRLPSVLLTKILTDCNSIDGTFYSSNKSINLWEDNVKHVLTMITDEAPTELNDNIIGHLMLLKDGNQLAFVEVSLNGDNNYVIYTVDEKKYYNKINAKGLNFFNKFMK